YDELAVEYANRLRYHQYLSAVNEKISTQNKRLRIQRKNLLLKNDELIAANLAKEVGLIVLASDKTVSPTSNCPTDSSLDTKALETENA
nr:hypothetical protein [Tanacetum cinerariifolium]